jgi:hypothetical protein
MKRFHVSVAVADIGNGVRFYSALFGAEPTVRKNDYARWMLDDPRINFAISQRGLPIGINHLGFQVDSPEEFAAMRTQLARADQTLQEQTGAGCCYTISDGYWVTDPTGMAWETFHTLDAIPIYGAGTGAAQGKVGCCVPLTATCGAASQACCAG